MMSNNIGYSSIFPKVGTDNQGSIGPIGPTGPAQTIPGSTGATGINSNYITQVIVNQETGIVEFVLSDSTVHSPGSIIGVTGIYAGLTAISVGSGYPILSGVCGGITLDFYNIRTGGLLGVTTDIDGSLKLTISANTTAGGISASTERNRIVYVKQKNYIMSTELIPESVSTSDRYGNTAYGFVNFGGETAGRNVVTEITERELSLGPIFRGEKKITVDDFYETGTEGITLDVSRASVYRITTPIGIKAFSTSNIGTIPNGQILSVTLFVDGDDVWNFPTNVYFDEVSKPVFYPGMNILHMWKSSTDTNWYAHFVARGYDISGVNNPGTKGSCCYSDIDGLKFCEDYVSEHYCNQLNGTFAALLPCSENPCNLNGQTPAFNGICCSEGRCISDLDPNTCQTIGGYYIDGITCGDYGTFPDSDVDNVTSGETKSGLCYNTCKTPTTCCKNGDCLGQLTQAHCEDLLGGISVIGTDNCGEANCCDRIDAPGACCTPSETSGYVCTDVGSPAECRNIGGVYMGKNTSCSSTQIENICCTIPVQCWECPQNGDQGDCGCVSKTIFTNGGTCEENGYFSDKPACDESCNSVVCHKCEGTDCVSLITTCATSDDSTPCPPGYTQGPCACNRKTCYNTSGCFCDQYTFVDIEDPNKSCVDLSKESGLNYPDEECTRPEYCGNRVACFWCFPVTNQYDSTGRLVLNDGTPIDFPDIVEVTRNKPVTQATDLTVWKDKVTKGSYAPYRSVALVSEETADALENAIKNNILPTTTTINLLSGVEKTVKFEKLPSSNKYYPYYEEIPSVDVNRNPLRLGSSTDGSTKIPEVIGPVYSVGNNVAFKCYYVSNYEFLTDDADSIKKEKCLKAIGYDTSKPNEAACELCDQLSDIDGRFYPQPQSLTFTNLEPYHNDFKSRKLFAPFPPVWGRITYNLASFQCGGIGTTIVQDTAAFGGLFSPVSNTTSDGYGGLYLLLDHAHGRGTEPKLKDYWQSIIDEYKKSFRNNSNVPVNYPQKSNLVTRKITNNLNELLGNNTIVLKSDVPTILPALNPPDNNYNQECVVLWNPAGPTDYLRFDPYLHGLNYSSVSASAFPYSGYIQYNRSFIYDCSQCFKSPIAQDSWFFISPGNEAYGKIAFDFDDTGKRYYPNTGDYNQNAEPTLDGVGEIYHFGYSTGSNKFELLPIIYGRNIRYNLDKFRTSSVFFDSEDQKTMKYSPITVIPIGWANIYSLPPELAPARPCGIAGPIDTIPVVCHSCGEGSPESGTDQCCGDGCLIGHRPPTLSDPIWMYSGNYQVPYCTNICTGCNDQHGCPPDNPFDNEGAEVNTFGILAPSNNETTTGGGGGGGPGFNFRSADSSITTKRVELIPGVCVDMKCPECNNYKSC